MRDLTRVSVAVLPLRFESNNALCDSDAASEYEMYGALPEPVLPL